MRIAFLFCHRPDQLWHAAPIAIEMSRLPQGHEVVLCCIDDALAEAFERIAAGWPDHRCRVERIELGPLLRLADRMLRSWSSLAKAYVLRFGAERFAGFDALVVPDLSSLKIKRRLPGLPMVFTNHGAGDRARGYDPRIARFDFVLVAGRKLEQRFIQEGLIRPGEYALAGYPKFDAVAAVAPETPRPFSNDLPTVLYNPHFEPKLSSWQPWGVSVLDYFRSNADRYNLIFAPHQKLFERRLRYGAWLPKRFRDCPGILVDTGSPALADMSYTRAADIYLGDVSSQIYEFLRTPRPCLFLDPHGIDCTTTRTTCIGGWGRCSRISMISIRMLSIRRWHARAATTPVSDRSRNRPSRRPSTSPRPPRRGAPHWPSRRLSPRARRVDTTGGRSAAAAGNAGFTVSLPATPSASTARAVRGCSIAGRARGPSPERHRRSARGRLKPRSGHRSARYRRGRP